jgi:hypothetical protein
MNHVATPPTPTDWQSFPVAALPSDCRRFVAESAGALGVDPSYVALPLLAWIFA